MTTSRALRWLMSTRVSPLLLGLALLLGGCAQTQVLQLHAVGQADASKPPVYNAASDEQVRRGVAVTRAGQALPAQVGLPLAEGDVVETGAGTLAVIRFPDGHEATLLPHSRVRLGSLFAEVGEVFVRVYGQLKDRFRVKTQYVTAGVEGTEFWVRVDAQGRQAFGVLDGRIRIAAPDDRWAPVEVRPGEVVSIDRDAAPQQERRLRAEADAIVDLMRRGARGLQRPLPPALPVRPR